MPLEHRKPRSSRFPAGYAVRLVAMTGALILIGATIYNLRDRAQGANAAGVVAERAPRHAAAEKDGRKSTEWKETIVPNPADDDPIEMDEARRLFEGVFDKHEMVESDMPAYWKLMKWARSQSFAELEQRAKRDVRFGDLFEHPDEHRGELVRLRLHVRMVIDHKKAPKNSAGVETTYDVWGVTDQSVSNFYLGVCSELPPEIPVADNVYCEAVFVGYFLKVLAYNAGDTKSHGAPLLIGRIKAVTGAKTAAAARSEGLLAMVAIGVAILLGGLIAVSLWRLARGKRTAGPASGVPSLPNAEVEAWLQNPGNDEELPQPLHSGNGSAHT